MIILFFILIFFSYLLRTNYIFKSIFIFSCLFSLFFILYYIILFFYIIKTKKNIISAFQIPEEIDNSELSFKFDFSKLFFITDLKLYLITDKSEILFNYDPKLCKFSSIPFYRGKHKIKKFHIQFSDPIRFFTIKINIKTNDFYNFFKYGNFSTHLGILPQTSNDIRKYNSMDDSILVRDYLFGDDIRKILWRIYAVTDDIKVRTNWLEKSSFNFIPLKIMGLFSENYFFTNLIIYKLYGLIKVLLQNRFNISINGKTFDANDDKKIQKELFHLYEQEKEKGINFEDESSSILLFSACAINKNPIKELWIPKNKSIYYITLKNFFSVEKKRYYNTQSFISLFVKRNSLNKITRFYFSNYFEYDELYEKRYQIV